MEAVYHKNNNTGSHFRFVPEPNMTEDQWNIVLDVLGLKNIEFITEDEFNKHHEGKPTTTIYVLDETNSYKIGELTCEYLDLDNIENETIL